MVLFVRVFFDTELNVNTFNNHHRIGQTEGLKGGCGIGWGLSSRAEWVVGGWAVSEVWVDRWAESEVKPKVL